MTEFLAEEVNRFCYWQTEREKIRLQKEESKFSPPWTDDPILQEFKFCQVFREDDRTTRWFRTHIREPLANSSDVIMATIIFRWFNFIPTGRTLIENDLLVNWDGDKAIKQLSKEGVTLSNLKDQKENLLSDSLVAVGVVVLIILLGTLIMIFLRKKQIKI